jgi:putrescine aminotransferase
MANSIINEKLTTEQYQSNARQYIWQFGSSLNKTIEDQGPLVFERAENIKVFDTDGNEYIDGMSGVWVVNAGHSNRKIIDAMTKQINSVAYALSEEGYSNTTAIKLAHRLISAIPFPMERVYFTCGGSESVEIAIRFSRVYFKLTGKPRKNKIIARRGSYHGATLLAFSISDFDIFTNAFGPTPQGITRTAHPYCYRCEFGLQPNTCECQCAEDLNIVIEREGSDTVAAFIAEPISTASGVAIPPAGYWKRIRDICTKHGVLLIADEIVTGFGRTGKLFGMEHFDVAPDIMLFAKGITSGYAPLGAIVMSKHLAETVPASAFLVPGYTFASHPVSCAAALANIEYILDERLAEQAAKIGTHLLVRLKNGLINHPFSGDIRGIGLLICVELVRDRTTKRQFNFDSPIADILTQSLRSRGLYLRLKNDQIHVAPPLTTSINEADQIADVILESLNELPDKLQRVIKKNNTIGSFLHTTI